ncbi:MAG: [Fe-Fe] hydrogenase large subunit C-terminal domain-containing protein, partial [Candidatus Limivicinus sp.]
EGLLAGDRQNEYNTWISSCCPSVNSYIKKYRPKALKYLAPVLTPMQAHAKLLRSRFPDAELVFIGPCLAKKGEAAEDGSDVSAVLLFEELENWLNDAGIDIASVSDPVNKDAKLSRLFPSAGGILKTMEKGEKFSYLSVDGFGTLSQTIDDIIDGKFRNCFIEMNFCRGGCIGGPSFQRKNIGTALSQLKVREAAGTYDRAKDFNITDGPDISAAFKSKRVIHMKPSEAQIEAVLRQMDKFSPEDELNCGMCGYSSCREKAEAVLQGKAEISMCLPYIRKKAENYADKVINSMPSAVLSVNMSLEILQINPAACAIFGMEAESLIGKPVRMILDEAEFVEALSSDKDFMSFSKYLPDYGVYIHETISPDRKSDLIICVLQDVTDEQMERRKSLKKKQQAAQIADKIIDDQLRMVHEIASLMGEAAAETKIAISDLKNTVTLDDEAK